MEQKREKINLSNYNYFHPIKQQCSKNGNGKQFFPFFHLVRMRGEVWGLCGLSLQKEWN